MTEGATRKKNINICSNCNATVLSKFIVGLKLCTKCYQRLMKSKKEIQYPKIPCKCGCGELIPSINKKGERAKYKHGHFIPDTRGHKNPMWRGGIRRSSDYDRVKAYDHPKRDSSNYVSVHRLEYEKHYKVCLLPWTLIHHINGNKKDNRIENLQPVTLAEHRRIHNIGNTYGKSLKKDMSNRFCVNCNGKSLITKHGSEKWFKYGDGFECNKCHKKRLYREKKNQSKADM